MSTETHQINLILGDWSNDGHGKTCTKTVRCNLSYEELQKAYVKGSEIVGFDFCDKVACEYQDSGLDANHASMLEKHGCNLFSECENFEGIYYLSTDLFARIFMFVCGVGADSKLEWEFVSKRNLDFHIGGYGLFS